MYGQEIVEDLTTGSRFRPKTEKKSLEYVILSEIM